MAVLSLLQQPVGLWLGAAGLFVLLGFLFRSGLFLAPAVAAGAAAAAALLLSRALDFTGQCYLFAAVSLIMLTPSVLRRHRVAEANDDANAAEWGPPEHPRLGTEREASAMVGKIGHTAEGFANGIGRVFIGAREWAAELAHGEETVMPGEALRVVGVTGRVKLLVEPLPRAG